MIALLGAFTAALALPLVDVFGHGFVLAALPALAVRLAVATAIVGGTVIATICIPAVIKVLEPSPSLES